MYFLLSKHCNFANSLLTLNDKLYKFLNSKSQFLLSFYINECQN